MCKAELIKWACPGQCKELSNLSDCDSAGRPDHKTMTKVTVRRPEWCFDCRATAAVDELRAHLSSLGNRFGDIVYYRAPGKTDLDFDLGKEVVRHTIDWMGVPWKFWPLMMAVQRAVAAVSLSTAIGQFGQHVDLDEDTGKALICDIGMGWWNNDEQPLIDMLSTFEQAQRGKNKAADAKTTGSKKVDKKASNDKDTVPQPGLKRAATIPMPEKEATEKKKMDKKASQDKGIEKEQNLKPYPNPKPTKPENEATDSKKVDEKAGDDKKEDKKPGPKKPSTDPKPARPNTTTAEKPHVRDRIANDQRAGGRFAVNNASGGMPKTATPGVKGSK